MIKVSFEKTADTLSLGLNHLIVKKEGLGSAQVHVKTVGRSINNYREYPNKDLEKAIKNKDSNVGDFWANSQVLYWGDNEEGVKKFEINVFRQHNRVVMFNSHIKIRKSSNISSVDIDKCVCSIKANEATNNDYYLPHSNNSTEKIREDNSFDNEIEESISTEKLEEDTILTNNEKKDDVLVENTQEDDTLTENSMKTKEAEKHFTIIERDQEQNKATVQDKFEPVTSVMENENDSHQQREVQETQKIQEKTKSLELNDSSMKDVVESILLLSRSVYALTEALNLQKTYSK